MTSDFQTQRSVNYKTEYAAATLYHRNKTIFCVIKAEVITTEVRHTIPPQKTR